MAVDLKAALAETKAEPIKVTNHKGLSTEAFTVKAITALRQEGRKGIHTVYSGFNAAFRKQYPDTDPIEAVNALVKAGKVASRFCRGGVMLYLPKDAPPVADRGADALKKILA